MDKVCSRKKDVGGCSEPLYTNGREVVSNINGMEEQLDFFFVKLNNAGHWLGIYTNDHQVCTITDGIIVQSSLLIWSTGQPDNYLGEQYHVYNGMVLNGYNPCLDDCNKSVQFTSICDLAVEANL